MRNLFHKDAKDAFLGLVLIYPGFLLIKIKYLSLDFFNSVDILIEFLIMLNFSNDIIAAALNICFVMFRTTLYFYISQAYGLCLNVLPLAVTVESILILIFFIK